MFVSLKNSTLLIVMSLTTIGCSAEATRVAREAADRQAQQNTAMTELNKEVARGSHRLVEADAQARHDMVGVHHDLQAERSRLDSRWSTLDSERQQLVSDRRTESLVVTVAPLIGGGLAVATLVGFCWWLLVSAAADRRVDARLNEVLLAEVLPGQSTLGLPEASTSPPRRLD